MAIDTQITDLQDIRRDLRDRLREVSSTGINDILDRWINTALYDIHLDPGNNWPWAHRRGYLLTHAPYTTGSVSITAAARTTVTGASTLWATAVTGMGFNNARAGGKMIFSGSNEVYEVSSVTNDTSIVLVNSWTGAALSAATYTYFEDEYALASDFLRPVDMQNFSLDWEIPFIGALEFRRRFPRNSIYGKPRTATLIQLGFSGSTTPRIRVVLNRAPDDEYSIPYHYITSNLAVSSAGVEQAQLTADTDEPIIPLGFRHVIPLQVLINFYRDRKDDPRAVEAQAAYIDLMRRMKGTTNVGAEDRPRFQPNMSRYLRRGRAKYDGGSYFDELRDRWR